MKNKFYLPFLLTIFISIVACSSDDEGNGGDDVVERDRAEQQIVDNDSLIGYFETHYYNSSALAMNSNPSINDIIITELPKDGDGNYLPLPNPSENTLLIDAVETHMVELYDTDYTYYILRVNQGGGDDMPNISDDIRINYNGFTQDNEVFDSTINPIELDLTSTIVGWRAVFPQFNTAETFMLNGDGTITFDNVGLGVMFLPSGMGYYSATNNTISAYSNLIFKFELFQTEENDHDGDGVPSYLEDIDGDLLFNDDSDDDTVLDILDIDDDGDGVLTINEDLEPDTDLEVDADGDGDPTNDIGDGDPTNDDTDGDGIPNYLDEDDDGSKEDDEDGDGIPDYIDNN